MNRLFAAFLLFLFMRPAFSQEVAVSNAPAPELDPEICRFFVMYNPEPGVAYVPGVDVEGHPVVEADIDSSTSFIASPTDISFPVTIDLARYLGIGLPEGVEAKTDVGRITIDDRGVLFNDMVLTGQAEDALRQLCTKGTAGGVGEAGMQEKAGTKE